MAKIAKKLTELIGHTPLMEWSGYSRKYGLQENIVEPCRKRKGPRGTFDD